MIMEQFAAIDLFGGKQCMLFVSSFYGQLLDGALFKVKKFMIPCMLALVKHIPYELFTEKFVTQFIKFNVDTIWGVRRVCIENMSLFIEKVKPQETQLMIQCLSFVQDGFRDESKWVKNQAFHQLGKVIHKVYLKAKEPGADKAQLTDAIQKICNAFYDANLLSESKQNKEGSESNQKSRPVSSSSTVDESDKIKE